MTTVWFNQILQGMLIGGLYALYAIGLSLSVGVMRFVNIAHGDLIVLACFVQWVLVTGLGLDPLVAVPILIIICALGAWLLQRLLLERVLDKGLMPLVLVTFGLSICIQNGLLGTFGADSRKVPAGNLDIASFAITDQINVGVLPLLIFGSVVLLIAVLNHVLFRTRLGARIRAVSESPATATLMGLPTAKLYAVSMVIIGISIGITAAFLSVWTNFDPGSGQGRMLIAFETVVLGGIGSLWGTLVGGIVLGVAQSIGAQFDTAWQALAGHIVFLVIFVVRPRGLFSGGSN